MLRLTLAARIALIVVIALLAVWIVAIAAFYRAHAAEMENARPDPERIAALVALIERGDAAERPLILRAATTDGFQPSLAVAPFSPPSKETAAGDAERRPYARALAGRSLEIVLRPRSPFGAWAPRLSAYGAALEFRIGLRTGETLVIDTRRSLTFNRLGLPVGFGAGLFGTLVALAALYIMQRETRPLARLAAAVDHLDLSPDPAPLPVGRRNAPEIRAVVAAFNRLQDRLGGLLKARMALIGGLSHDVRTFATRLRLRVDQIPDEAERSRAAADIDDMIRLLDDALLSSQAGAGELSQEMVEFAALVKAEVDDRSAKGRACDLRIAPGAEAAIVLGDRLALRRIIGNLIDNAIKYGGAAHVEVAVSGNAVRLIVDDEGPGIPAAARDTIFEPFNRLEKSRSRETGGAGLGLAIVRTLAEAHGGGAAIGDASKGARVIVTLPLFSGAEARGRLERA
jgi:signal transduction histidine kinase